MSRVIKVLIILGVIFAVLSALLATLVVSSFVSSCSDSPTHDSREVRAFIEKAEVSARDLETFDALRGCIENMHDQMARNIARNGDDGTGEETHRHLITVDEYRQSLERGTWPGRGSGYETIDSPHSPRLWVRLAELSEDQIEEATAEDWEVVDFSYPFPHGNSAPVPATRSENDVIRTLLVCRTGADTGLYATVYYWRWADPAHFEVHIDEARETHEALARTARALEETDALAGRQFLYNGIELVVWELGGYDPLRDPEAFVEFANESVQLIGDSIRFSLVKHDTPVALAWEEFSADYPNVHELEHPSFETGRELLLHAGRWRLVDYAPEDLLLSTICSTTRECTVSSLSGELAPDNGSRSSLRWDKPSYGCLFDHDIEDIAREHFGCGTGQPMIAVSERVSRGDIGEDTDLNAWIIVPRGVFAETPSEFCAEVNGLRDKIWDSCVDGPIGEQQRNLYLWVVVIDGESIVHIVGDGTLPSSFGELAQAMHEDMGCLDQYDFDITLVVEASLRQWHEEWRLNRFDATPDKVKGTIADSREWRYPGM